MIDKIRKFLLISALGLVLISAYFLYTKYQTVKLPVEIRATQDGVDVTIENFKVVHEEDGHTAWELIAKSAKINNEKKVTHLSDVWVKVDAKNKHVYWVSADQGVLENETQDFVLEGNVKFTAKADSIINKFKKNQPEPQPLPTLEQKTQ